MKLLSITEVAKKHKKPRNTVASAVRRGYLKIAETSGIMNLIEEEEAEYYFNGPPFPYWWSFQQVASLGIPITILYTLKDRYAFDCKPWKKNLYAYIPGNRGIEKILKKLGYLVRSKPMIQMERPIIK